ncbi:MAG: 2Fe-2S iron-sulfur cluster-binding protein [Myxococcota bacterium]|jgi:NADH dehydrogenase/NADH:ubiquinone oxidoreductase subunit G|nr:2Fe-2S iron-sulfur cluster-binding protein [Myxococcota bacterium]
MTVKFKINGVEVEAQEGVSVLDTARRYGFEVPSLCHHEAIAAYGACRVCLVEITKGGRSKLTTSCNYEVLPGIEVVTDSPKIRKHRAMVLELILSEAPGAQAVRRMAAEHGVDVSRFVRPADGEHKRDNCILCGLCARVCTEVVGVSALTFNGRGDRRGVGSAFMDQPQSCIACGACAWVCPTDCVGFEEKDGMRKVVRWGRELPMAKDEQGRPVAPTYQLFHFQKVAKLPADFYKKSPGNRS